ncbi:MAG: aminoacetone oxidase family FAD-binding enzyme [Lachnospiraceae bacterium]|nr:aminoacetone oxidase family FAD-binding enzyme [Lachnospiraceae bacterium]
MSRVAVAGGGASGMTAAVFASRAGAQVTIFERNDRVGKKLLMTGNGKCNLTHENVTEKAFHTFSSPGFIAKVLDDFSAEDTLAFFSGLGIHTRVRSGGIYPYPETASAVLDVLRMELKRLNVRLLTGRKVSGIKRDGQGRFFVNTVPRAGAPEEPFDAVILSCGGAAAPKTGSDGNGFDLAEALGLPVIKPLPALTMIKSSAPFFKGIAGVRAEASLKLISEGRQLGYSRGELQLTDRGLSGICAFDLSGTAGREIDRGRECTVVVNFLPDYDLPGAEALLKNRFLSHPERKAAENLTGLFHKQLNSLFLRLLGVSPEAPSKSMTEKNISGLASFVTALSVPVTGVGDFSRAQITSGGVELSSIGENFEVKSVPGLFITGELLDADGICGGYNLQWAWSSGALAGMAAAGTGKKTGR